jgi:hypothetical protein
VLRRRIQYFPEMQTFLKQKKNKQIFCDILEPNISGETLTGFIRPIFFVQRVLNIT